MEKRKRARAALAAAVCAALLLCALFVAAEIDHDCAGAYCPVCAQIRACENLLQSFALALAAAAAALALAFTISHFAAPARPANGGATPIKLKVKLSN